MNKEILCSVSTKGRYETTLPLCLSSIINQTKLPNHLIVFDDNDEPKDLRDIEIYRNLFGIMDLKGLSWEIVYGQKKGQHFNHQIANKWGYKWVWRVDDDCIPNPNVLENLYKGVDYNIGCIAGSVITPWWNMLESDKVNASGKIEDIYSSSNKQWYKIDVIEEVDHVHCTFLYRAGVVDYNLNLSRVAHREESLFSYEFIKKGYKNLLVPNAISYHLKSQTGGIRDGLVELYEHDERIFNESINVGTLIVLDSGIGDHFVFESILDDVIKKYKKVTIASCYPEVFKGYKVNNISIADASKIVDMTSQNIYKNMADWNWSSSLQDAYRKLYL